MGATQAVEANVVQHFFSDVFLFFPAIVLFAVAGFFARWHMNASSGLARMMLRVVTAALCIFGFLFTLVGIELLFR